MCQLHLKSDKAQTKLLILQQAVQVILGLGNGSAGRRSQLAHARPPHRGLRPLCRPRSALPSALCPPALCPLRPRGLVRTGRDTSALLPLSPVDPLPQCSPFPSERNLNPKAACLSAGKRRRYQAWLEIPRWCCRLPTPAWARLTTLPGTCEQECCPDK